MPVQKNLQDLEESIKETKHDLSLSAREAQALRADYGLLEHSVAEAFKQDLITFMQEIGRLNLSLKRVVQGDTEDTAALHKLTKQQTKEKIMLQEAILNTASSVTAMEELIGCVKPKLSVAILPGVIKSSEEAQPGNEYIDPADIDNEYPEPV